MKFAVKRLDEHDERVLHIVDTDTRGLVLHYTSHWDWVKRQDLNKPQGMSLIDYLVKNGYMPLEASKEEFYRVYNNASSGPLFIDFGTLKPEDAPSLGRLIEMGYEELISEVKGLASSKKGETGKHEVH